MHRQPFVTPVLFAHRDQVRQVHRPPRQDIERRVHIRVLDHNDGQPPDQLDHIPLHQQFRRRDRQWGIPFAYTFLEMGFQERYTRGGGMGGVGELLLWEQRGLLGIE